VARSRVFVDEAAEVVVDAYRNYELVHAVWPS
jgi:hypothetical protein